HTRFSRDWSSDVCSSDLAVPRVHGTATVSEALAEISRKMLGMTAVVDDADRLIGLYTDGDLRRSLDAGVDVRSTPIAEVMTRRPRTIGPDALAAEAAQLMEAHKIGGLVVVDGEHRVVGAL